MSQSVFELSLARSVEAINTFNFGDIVYVVEGQLTAAVVKLSLSFSFLSPYKSIY